MADAGLLSLLVRTVVSLAIVLAIVGVAYLVARRRAGGRPGPSRRGERGRAAGTTLDVVGRVGLSRGTAAVAIRFGERVVLVAAAEQGPSSVLAEMTAEEWDDLQVVRERLVPEPAVRSTSMTTALGGSPPAGTTRPGFVDALREATTRRV